MGNYNEKIMVILRKIGAKPALLGYKYTIEALKITLEDDNAIYALTKHIYPSIAKKFNVTSHSVERAIRHLSQSIFTSMNSNIKRELFGDVEHLTNSDLLATLVQTIKYEPNNPIWKM